MKNYFAMTEAERVELSDLTDAIKAEAILRGITIPVDGEILKDCTIVGSNAGTIWWGIGTNHYDIKIVFPTLEMAQEAIKNARTIDYNGMIGEGEPIIQAVTIGKSQKIGRGGKLYNELVKEWNKINEDYLKLEDECREDWTTLRASLERKRRNDEEFKEYLRLAGGDDEIAQVFWAKNKGSRYNKD